MNRTIIIGNLTADPVRKATQAGKELATFTVAVNSGRGENKKTTFFRCTAWEKQAAPILTYLHKGDKVCVTGEVGASAYMSDGEAKASLDLTVRECEFLETRRRDEKPMPDGFTATDERPPW